MTTPHHDQASSSPANGNNPDGPNTVNSLTLKDYLETAIEASRRTRFITIIMIVASVLVLVSVLNSSDDGWITLRHNAIRRNAAPYTVRKFPLLCKCDAQVREQRQELCAGLEGREAAKDDDLFWTANTIDAELKKLDGELAVKKAERDKVGKD